MFSSIIDPLQPYFVMNADSYYKMMFPGSSIAHFYRFTCKERIRLQNGAVPDGTIDILFNCDPDIPSAFVAGTVERAGTNVFLQNHTYFGVRFLPGIPALLGLNNPFVVEKVKKYLDAHLITMDPLMLHQTTAAFSHNMSLITPYLPRTVVCCGGAEAVETLLKMVRLASYRTKKGRTRMLSTNNAFHGKTQATVNLGGKAKWRMWQGPDLPGYTHVPFGDWRAAEEEMKKGDVIAFFCEPIQGEGGINVPPEDYLPKMRELCTKYDVYFCLDEVQAGSCRTGYLWAHQYYGDKARPDALTFAKAMSDSLVPVGGVLASEELYMAAYGNDETAFFHTATYQDNQISGITALACLEFMIEADVPGTIRKNAPYFWDGLYRIQKKYPNIIKDVRGRGYMIGIEYGQNKAGEYYTVEVCKHMSVVSHVSTMFTINNDAVCRIYPNYWATKEDFDWALKALDDACAYVTETMDK